MNNLLIGKTVAFLNLGCKVNAYETDALVELFEAEGAKTVSFDDAADIYVVNTCSVTNIADRKSRQMLHRARQKNPDALIVATGCYAQIGGERLNSDGDADVVVGNNRKTEVVEAVLEALERDSRGCRVDDLTHERRYEPMNISDYSERSRAFVKIEDGCNQFCSYCIIPYARGRVRSREEADVVAEVKRLADAGFKEVVLTGIHLSSYGNSDYEKTGVFRYEPLMALIRSVAAVDGIERIRLGSLEPRIISESFATELASIPEICPQFHLSLQSGSNSVLKRMNRHYSAEEFLTKCEILRRAFDNPAITTDIIVGFPGETEEEFVETCEFAEKVCFAKIHIFKYSRRKGTVADRMQGQIIEAIKHDRAEKLGSIDERLHREYLMSCLGSPDRVLTEECVTRDGKTFTTGLTTRYMSVLIEGEVGVNTIYEVTPERVTDSGELM